MNKRKSLLFSYQEAKSQLTALSNIARADSAEDAWAELEAPTKRLGFDYAGVGVLGLMENGVEIDLNHATEFMRKSFDEYHHKDLHLTDPSARALVHGARMSYLDRAIVEAPPHLRDGADKVAEHLRKDAVAGHASFRVDMPGRPFASFLGIGQRDHTDTGDFHARVEEHYDLLNLAATAYTSVALRNFEQPNADILSQREARILTLLARGLTAREIAEEEGRALSTVRQQIASARRQLGARTTAQAITIALEIGAIPT